MKFNSAICVLFLVINLSSCKEIFEPSIEKSQVKLLAPSNGYSSSNYTVNFWFEPVEDALFYRLQVVNPKFDSIGSVVLDTLINREKFTCEIDPGRYEWRVRAENGSSKTNYTEPRSFSINLGSLTDQKVRVSAPANNTITNQSMVSFIWEDIFGANNYRLQVDDDNFNDPNNLFYNQITPGLQATILFSTDQVYQWRVRAENDTEQSQWSAINIITYDHTPPAKVTLMSPDNEQLIIQPVNLQWNAASAASRYKLYVYQSDSTTLFNQAFPLTLNTTSYSFNLGSFNERIYWKVSAVDDAGNEGEASQLRSFIAQ